jgi:hypothetical protein
MSNWLPKRGSECFDYLMLRQAQQNGKNHQSIALEKGFEHQTIVHEL